MQLLEKSPKIDKHTPTFVSDLADLAFYMNEKTNETSGQISK